MENGNNISLVAVEEKTIGKADISASSGDRKNDIVSADYRKLFVGNLHRETGEQSLRDHFGKYGEIEHINIKTDPATGKSRGFAFIVFKSSEALSNVEAVVDHVINGRKVDPKKAKTRQGRIFVGGLSSDLTDEDIKEHFAQFGTIAEAHMPFDKIKNQRKGFCFIVYESEEVVRSLLRRPKQNIKGKEVDVKRAESKPDQPGGSMMGSLGGRGSMRGGGGYEMQGFNNQNFGDDLSHNYRESKPIQTSGSMHGGRGGRGGMRGARGNGGGYQIPGFNNRNFGDDQSYNYIESKSEQLGDSLMGGRGGRGGMRGTRGRGGDYQMPGFNNQNFDDDQSYNYRESKSEQLGDSLMGGRGGRGSMRGDRGRGGGYQMPGFNNQNFNHDQSYNYRESKPERLGDSMMGGRGGRGGMRGARSRGGGNEMQDYNEQNFGDEQAYSYHETKYEQPIVSIMRGRGGHGGIRGARGGLRGGHGMQGCNQHNGQGSDKFGSYDYDGSAAYSNGYGQRYQPY